MMQLLWLNLSYPISIHSKPAKNNKQNQIMSILNKLESTYLNFLRITVIVTATIFLITTVYFGVKGAIGFTDYNNTTIKPRKVTTYEVVEQIYPSKTQKNNESAKEINPNNNIDTLDSIYKKITSQVNTFVVKHSQKTLNINEDAFLDLLKSNTNNYKDSEIQSLYINGMSELLDEALTNKKVLSKIIKTPNTSLNKDEVNQENTSEGGSFEDSAPTLEVDTPYDENPVEVVISIIEKYTTTFDEKLETANFERNEKIAEKSANLATSLNNLYIAGGAFIIFLIIVFMSILVKIERNIRSISER